MNLKGQVSVELIIIAAIVVLFGASITALIMQSSNSTMAIAVIKEETLNALSNESFEYFIQRIDFYFDNDKSVFDVYLQSTQTKTVCAKLDEVKVDIKNKIAKFYDNPEINVFVSGKKC